MSLIQIFNSKNQIIYFINHGSSLYILLLVLFIVYYFVFSLFELILYLLRLTIEQFYKSNYFYSNKFF